MATEFPPYQIESVEVLLPQVQNARTHTDAQISQIARSIQEFGFTNPLIVDDKKEILAGHGRLLAAKRLGMTHVPTVRLSDLTPEQKRAYILADNRLALSAGWDDDILRMEINNLRDSGFDVDLTGFSEAELDQLFVAEADPNALWKGMPEFHQPDAFAFRSIVVHFKDAEGVEMFKKVIDQPQITNVTKFIWFPPVPEESYMDRHYTTDAEAPEGEVAVKMRLVQLALPGDVLPGFMEKVQLLGERFETNNISETIARAVESCYKDAPVAHAE